MGPDAAAWRRRATPGCARSGRGAVRSPLVEGDAGDRVAQPWPIRADRALPRGDPASPTLRHRRRYEYVFVAMAAEPVGPPRDYIRPFYALLLSGLAQLDEMGKCRRMRSCRRPWMRRANSATPPQGRHDQRDSAPSRGRDRCRSATTSRSRPVTRTGWWRSCAPTGPADADYVLAENNVTRRRCGCAPIPGASRAKSSRAASDRDSRYRLRGASRPGAKSLVSVRAQPLGDSLPG